MHWESAFEIFCHFFNQTIISSYIPGTIYLSLFFFWSKIIWFQHTFPLLFFSLVVNSSFQHWLGAELGGLVVCGLFSCFGGSLSAVLFSFLGWKNSPSGYQKVHLIIRPCMAYNSMLCEDEMGLTSHARNSTQSVAPHIHYCFPKGDNLGPSCKDPSFTRTSCSTCPFPCSLVLHQRTHLCHFVRKSVFFSYLCFFS